jgi:hypothetical protein
VFPYSPHLRTIVEGIMKKEKAIRELKIERPRRVVVSEKEALKRMKDFSKRKESFLATARTGKTRVVPADDPARG